MTISKKSSKTAAKKSSKTAAKKSSKTAAKKSSKVAAKKSSKVAAKKSSKVVAKKSSKTAAKKSSKTVARKSSKTATRKTSKTVARKSSKTATRKTSKTATRKTSKRVSSRKIQDIVIKVGTVKYPKSTLNYINISDNLIYISWVTGRTYFRFNRTGIKDHIKNVIFNDEKNVLKFDYEGDWENGFGGETKKILKKYVITFLNKNDYNHVKKKFIIL